MTLVFKSAILRGQRDKANPCDGVAKELGPRHQEVEHHRALPHAEVSAVIMILRNCNSSQATRLAFEWLVLTVTRSGEARLARWSEIDEPAALWVVPARRMKMKRLHVVPLSARCLDQTIWYSPGHGAPLSDMTLRGGAVD